ncbi:hypothetical protein ACP70R_032726 [Stipagrostis hirtigluma subsp. patula]
MGRRGGSHAAAGCGSHVPAVAARTGRRSGSHAVAAAAPKGRQRRGGGGGGSHDIPGMKFLVLDPQTVGMVSMVYSLSDLLRKEVFLVETVDNASSSTESMAHLKAVRRLCSKFRN